MNRKLRRAAAKAPQAPDLMAEGLQHHRAGRLQDAEACYEKLLASQPGHAHTLYLRGVLAQQRGEPALGLESLRGAVRQAPGNALYLYNLGVALTEQNKFAEAIETYRRAIEIEPEYAEAHGNLGRALAHLGEPEAAIAAYRRAVAARPNYAIAHSNLASTLQDLGRREEAEASCRRAIAIDPDFAAAHLNLGVALDARGDHEAAIDAYRRAIAIEPNHVAAHSNLGRALADQGRLEEAIEACRRAIGIEPGFVKAHYHLGAALNDIGRSDDAVASYRRGIGLETDSASPRYDKAARAKAHYNIGVILAEQGRLADAIVAYLGAVEIDPGYAEALSNLGGVFKDQGRLEEAISTYRRAIRIKPDFAGPYSNLALCMNYGDGPLAEEFDAHVVCSEVYDRSAPPRTVADVRDVGGRLRIGYVSPDFRRHSVAYFFEPLLMAHDPRAVEVFCYAEVSRPDATTSRLRARADHWRDTVGVSDDDMAERIRADGVDILVDLAGHTAKNRLGVFARRPAPVQVAWLGYPNTTGLTAIDYRLVDPVTDPVGEADERSSERLLRLDGGFLCYSGAPDAPEPAMPPSSSGGAPTFGSFNNPAKLSPRLLDGWASLLDRLPESRLLLKGKPFADPATRALFLSRMSERGVSPARLELVGWLPTGAAHLDLYKRIDVALDPFPYNGTTTTCEALWMGVPVVTLRGDRHRGRVGASLLSQIGLTDWIADSIDEYQDIAIGLASDPRTLIELRGTLRARMRSSRLCDAEAHARQMEAAFRAMWSNRSGKVSRDLPRSLERSNKMGSTTMLTLVDGVRVVVPDSVHLITPYVLREQLDWFEDEIKFLRRLLQPGQKAIDIGANYGVYTLGMAARVGPNGHVWAFEPASGTAKLLADSIAANGFTQITLERSAVSAAEGSARLSLNANSEMNALTRGPAPSGAGETVPLATLDGCLETFGWRDIEFVKIDAEGEEAAIVKGGTRFFAEMSPLVQYEVKAGPNLHLELVRTFAALGYASYRLTPGLDLLVPFDAAAQPDGFLLNLFCCKPDMASRLAARGFLLESIVPAPSAAAPMSVAYHWRRALAELPYAVPLEGLWSQTVAAGQSGAVEEALALFALSRDPSLPVGERFLALKASFERFEALCDREPSHLRRSSFARVALDFGARSAAVAALKSLSEEFVQNQRVDPSEPFLAPSERFDSVSPGASLGDWIAAAVLEALERAGHYSSFYTGQATRRRLELIRQLGFGSAEMQRRSNLVQQRFG